MYSKTSRRLNKFCFKNILNLFLLLLYNILYFLFRKLIVYYKYYIFLKKKIFEKKSEFKCYRILKLEKENEVINNKLVEISAKIKTNATNTINQEQYTRRTMVEVNNIPKQESEKENSLDIIYKLLDLLKLNLDRKTIDVAHRLSDKPDSPIIVKFTTRSARDLFFNNRSRLANHTIADLGCNIDPNKKSKKIFINESLSHSIKVLFKEVRNQCEKKNYSYAWTRNGVIFIRKNKDSQAIRINSEDDFSRKIR